MACAFVRKLLVLSIPLVDERFDLVGKFAQVLVGPSPIAPDNFQKLLAHSP